MKSLTNKEKVIRWASNKRSRNIKHMITELNMIDEKQLMFHLNRMVRNGWVTFKRIGQQVTFRLTKTAYHNRTLLGV